VNPPLERWEPQPLRSLSARSRDDLLVIVAFSGGELLRSSSSFQAALRDLAKLPLLPSQTP
jgi:hypothetical protein